MASAEANRLAADYGGSTGQEGALLNGLLALGYPPAKVAAYADADPNRRYLNDAITRALRDGVSEEDIRRALRATRAAVTAPPDQRQQAVTAALGIDPALNPANRGFYDALVTGGEVPFKDRGDMTGWDPRQGAVRPAAGPQTQQVTGPSGSAGYLQQRGAPPEEVAAATVTGRQPGTVTSPGQRAPGTATQAGGGGGGATTDTTPALGAGASQDAVNAYVRKYYSQYAWMLDVPDIAAVMRQAAEKGWEDEEVWGAFIASPWYKKTEPDVRTWMEKKSVDPAGAREAIGKHKTVLRNQALSLGITIPPGDMDALAEDSLKFNWDDNELRAALGRYYAYDPKNLLGAAQATAAHLKQAAKDWLVPIDETTIGRWTEQVMRGEMTTDYFDTYLAGQARSLYPQLEEPISRGVAPSQWMAPYTAIAAETLGLDPKTIDLREPKWLRAINQVDEKGGRKPMTLYDWQNLLKTDESFGWDKTQQGRDHGAGLARRIAAQFGFATGGGL